MVSMLHDLAPSPMALAGPTPNAAATAPGPAPPARRRRSGLLRMRLVAGGSAAMCVVAVSIAATGLLPMLPVLLVSGYCLLGHLVFYGLRRSGRNARFRDPGFVFASHLFTISVLLFGCVLIPEDRSVALPLFLLIWAHDLSRLSRRQQLIAAAVAVLGLSAIFVATRPENGDVDPEWLRHVLALVTTAFYIPSLVAIGHTVRSIDSRQEAQRAALAEALVQLQALSERDALTGVSNRRHGETLLEQEAARQSRTGRPFSVCLLDLDHFKRINDLHGHTTGDAVLVGTAHLLREALPEPCTVARWGGEEFLVLMPDTGRAEAARRMEQARSTLGGLAWPESADGLRVNFSAGVCEHRTGESVAATLDRADRALYRAKAQGRGQVVDDEPGAAG